VRLVASSSTTVATDGVADAHREGLTGALRADIVAVARVDRLEGVRASGEGNGLSRLRTVPPLRLTGSVVDGGPEHPPLVKKL